MDLKLSKCSEFHLNIKYSQISLALREGRLIILVFDQTITFAKFCIYFGKALSKRLYIFGHVMDQNSN